MLVVAQQYRPATHDKIFPDQISHEFKSSQYNRQSITLNGHNFDHFSDEEVGKVKPSIATQLFWHCQISCMYPIREHNTLLYFFQDDSIGNSKAFNDILKSNQVSHSLMNDLIAAPSAMLPNAYIPALTQ